jgi:cysteinyl-tRNA synthetase
VIFSQERLQHARRTLQRLDDCVATLQQIQQGREYGELDQILYDLKNGFVTAMDDDLNISAALAAIFKVVKRLNRLAAREQVSPGQVAKVLEGFRSIDAVLGIFHFDPVYNAPDAQALLRQRDQARLARDWELADRLRDELNRMGVVVRDSKVS